MTELRLAINSERIGRNLDRLAEFSDAPSPAVTRVLFTPTDMLGRQFICDLMQQVGLQVRLDAAGNIFGRWLGTKPELPPVATGSHCDAIPHSGRYDGTVGVIGAIEAIAALRESGFQPQRSLEVIMFNAEEPTRYGIGCLGSRLMSGRLTPPAAADLRDEQDETFEITRTAAGCVGSLDTVPLPAGCYRAFVELHIEQGPLLEQQNLPIGIVTAIAAPAALRVTFVGEGGHAGAVLMPQRKDALLPAAELALAAERAARELGGADTVATVGILEVHPGAINSIPSRCEMTVDVRDIDLVRRDQVLTSIQQQAASVGNRRNVATTVTLINADPPARCDETVVAAIENATRAANLPSLKMISRAYHDSLFMALIAPTSMIFIPCRGGVSHRPDEYASPAAIQAGVEVLARTLAQLSQE
ncbi:N-carbamoyl-L-amino acid hydrolase [Anatilimnocola aggregata]|uniref:N-carbamoyl-L-amino acid hydrolase n=1 Tax=Anatilimnocola aggregata TaxID=2528021 RepID=A0A517YDL0_9BACT|nr:M20 family metallo-hydrolase [Anatilimnocola aggregata]QDU28279.1 N-carbamoyl-L-amino acid hydrolase [Anatilimnocola aggregata]